LAKLAGVLLVAGGIATGAVIWNRSPRPAPQAVTTPVPTVQREPALEPQPLSAQPADPRPVAARQPVVTSLAAPAEARAQVPAAEEPSARAELAPAITASAPRARRVVATRIAQPALRPKATRAPQRVQPPADSPETTTEDVSAGAAPTEIELLRRAQLALRARPRESFRLTEEHRQRFPRGAFALERDALAIQALIRAGDADMARDLAESFVRAHPDSPHAHRFREAMGLH
jgi:hypothetical protein